MAGIDSYTKLMLHCNGTNGSTTFTDDSASAHTVTANGSFQVQTAQSQFGGASGHSDGASTSRLTIADSADWNFGSGDFSIDFWYRPSSVSGTTAIISQWGGGGSNGSFYLDCEGGTIKMYFQFGSGEDARSTGITAVVDTWQHIAVCRSGNTVYFFKDGTQTGTTDVTGKTISDSSRPLNISTYADGAGQSFSGWIDEIRISKGIARWTSGFTPETSEYTAVSPDATVIPDVLLTTVSLLTPTVQYDVTVTPSLLEITSSLLTPANVGSITTITPSILDASVTILTPSLLIDSTIIPNILQIVSSILTPILPPSQTSEFIHTDIRYVELVKTILGININTTNGVSFGTDLRWMAITSNIIGVDIRFNAFDPALPETPISRLDFHVFINNVEVSDVKMDAINVYHTDYEKSRATISLTRHHDDLNYTLEGVFSEITNQNPLRVEINGYVEFSGYIWDIDTNSENEIVNLTAYTDAYRGNERSSVTLSLPSINEPLRLHHALVNNPRIESPRLIAGDPNPSVYGGILVDMGYEEKQYMHYEQMLGNSASLAESVTNGTFIPRQNWTYFWFGAATNFITGASFGHGFTQYLGTSPSGLTGDTWSLDGLSYITQRIYPNKKVRLGDGKVYLNDFIGIHYASPSTIFTTLVDRNYILNDGTITQLFKDSVVGVDAYGHIVTFDLGFTDSNSWVLQSGYYVYSPSPSMSTLNSNVFDIVNGSLGYSVGVPPFKKISTNSGRFIATGMYIDKPNGLYTKKDVSYDWRDFAKKIADFEYRKLSNINGQVLPKTSADIEIFIDAYYYYNIQLLKRINVDNTIRANIYNNNNGFPLSVKSIEINSGTMKVSLRCDNTWSQTEMLELEALYPNPYEALYYQVASEDFFVSKMDPRTLSEVQ